MGRHHGSLNRAGKVKNATPIITVCRKKQQKTSRSKKRQLYNKRFSELQQQAQIQTL